MPDNDVSAPTRENSISELLARGNRILNRPIPKPELPDAETVRRIALSSDEPRRAVREHGEHLYDEAVAADRVECEHLLAEIPAHRARLEKQKASAIWELDRRSRNVIDFDDPKRLNMREKLSLSALALGLVAVIAVSIGAISTMLMQTSDLNPLQIGAFGITPALGALLGAFMIERIRGVQAYRRARTIAIGGALISLIPWAIFLQLAFGSAATVDVDLFAEQMMDGGLGAIAEGDRFKPYFFLAALFYDVTAGASMKVLVIETLSRPERPRPEQSAFHADSESELSLATRRLDSVNEMEGRIEARLAEIRAGRDPFVEKVEALLFEPPPTPPAPAPGPPRTHSPAPAFTAPFDLSTSNGSYQ